MRTLPFLGETKVLDDAARSTAPGSFIALSDGFTHYELGGNSPLPLEVGPGEIPDRGERVPVVLVHGFSVPYFIWDPTFDFLTQSGFQVLRYDLFGRGFSDRPKLRYNIELFCKQLREMTGILGFERFDLVGLSLGGPISATFTTRYPERIRRLVLIDPAGVRAVTLTRLLHAARILGVGRLIRALFGSEGMAKGVEFDFYNPAHDKAFVAKYSVQMEYKGFKRALLSTVRNGMLGDFMETYRKIGQQGVPTLLFWGRDDHTVPFEHSDLLCEAIPQARLQSFELCGHIPHYEKAQEANPPLLEFLR